MKQLTLFVFKLLLLTGIPLVVQATDVYRTVDENGNVVFSDKKTHDAKTIDVQPNVVDVDIPDMPESSTQTKSNKQVSNNSAGANQEMGGWNANYGSNKRRRVRTETNGEGVNQNRPSATPAGRPGGR